MSSEWWAASACCPSHKAPPVPSPPPITSIGLSRSPSTEYASSTVMRVRPRTSALENHGEPLADPDADGGKAEAAAPTSQLVGERAEDARTRTADGMADRDRPAVGIDLLGVELGPVAQACERLRRERFVELDDREVLPPDPRA